jgi:hypothetical protein
MANTQADIIYCRSKTLTTTNCFLDLLLFHNCYRSRPPPQITTLLPSNTEISKLDRAKNIQSFVVHNKHTFFPEGLYYAAYAKYLLTKGKQYLLF